MRISKNLCLIIVHELNETTAVLINLRTADLLKTILLAAVGAVVSFSISWLLRMLVRRFF